MSSNVSASLVLEETSEEVCLRSNRTEVQTTRQFIRSQPTGSQSSQRRTLVYIANFAGLRRMSRDSGFFTSAEGFVCSSLKTHFVYMKSLLSHHFINLFYLVCIIIIKHVKYNLKCTNTIKILFIQIQMAM